MRGNGGRCPSRVGKCLVSSVCLLLKRGLFGVEEVDSASVPCRRGGGAVSQDESDGGFVRSFSTESKRALGLAPEEGVRLLARTGRAILLERAGDSGLAVPTDRDLVLSSDLRSFPLADLLALLHDAGKSGYLLFASEGEQKAIYLRRGEVVFASSSLVADRLGACLLRAGLIDRDQLDLAERRYHPATRFGKVIVELGILTPRELWSGVKTQVEEIVRSLFSYTAGWIHFWEGEIEPDNVVRLSLPMCRLIEEGLACRDDVHPPAHLEQTGLAAIGCDEPGEIGSRTQADDDVVREAVELYAKLVFELAAPLIALDGAGPLVERLDRILEESAERGRTLLEGVRVSEQGTLDPASLADRALRLGGDRVRAVDEALGELVAYLEFELKNHPKIDDCAAFLEAVEPLRAMLAR